MGGISMPYESGQSGTARPEPVLVTRPPTKMSASVQTAVRTPKRCRQGWYVVIRLGGRVAPRGDAPASWNRSALEGEVGLGRAVGLDADLLRLVLELLVH